jgi:CDP-diacylglycerol---glycerol-3-phosphate 3-phosphatidyltransferase
VSLGRDAKPAWNRVVTPLARGLLGLGVSPDALTWAGAALSVVTAGVAIAQGWWVPGALLLAALLLLDSVDGQMARLSGRTTRWGAFLDSTLDRVTDAVVFGSVAAWYLLRTDTLGTLGTATGLLALAVLPGALVVSYARARAEAVGADGNVGFAERTERLVVLLAALLAVGLGAPHAVMTGALALLLLGVVLTIGVRMAHVHDQLTRADAPAGRTEP